MNTKTVQVWFAVNKSGFVGLYSEEPKRNESVKKWESQYPFVNAVLYKEIQNIVEKTGMNWDSEPECITIGFK